MAHQDFDDAPYQKSVRHYGASQKFQCAISENDAPWRTWRTPELSLGQCLCDPRFVVRYVKLRFQDLPLDMFS